MEITRLPVETMLNIFLLAIQNSHPSTDTFHTGSRLLDCVSLIDISRVCRRWRDLALADATLWAAPYVYLNGPSTKTMRLATYFVKLCFQRSRGLPLNFSIIISKLKGVWQLHVLQSLWDAVVDHKDRWERIHIDFGGANQGINSTNPLLCKGMHLLKALHIHLKFPLEFGTVIEQTGAEYSIPHWSISASSNSVIPRTHIDIATPRAEPRLA